MTTSSFMLLLVVCRWLCSKRRRRGGLFVGGRYNRGSGTSSGSIGGSNSLPGAFIGDGRNMGGKTITQSQ